MRVMLLRAGVLAAILLAPADGGELLATAGSYKRFLDEPATFAYGAALRIPVMRRLAVRPEIIADHGRYYSNVLALGSVTFDFTDPGGKAVGYVVGSAGGLRTREDAIFTATTWSALAGVGVRFPIAGKWTGAAEFRAGMPAFPLVTFNIGYRFGKAR